MLKHINQKLDFCQLFLRHQAIVFCKYYLDFWLGLKSDLEINHIFCTVIKTYFIKSPKLFGKTRSIMGGFHILLIKLKILYKKYTLLCLQQWWLKSKIIAESSVNQAAEGKHCSRAIHFHKQSPECLLRFQLKKIIADLRVDVMKKVKKIFDFTLL